MEQVDALVYKSVCIHFKEILQSLADIHQLQSKQPSGKLKIKQALEETTDATAANSKMQYVNNGNGEDTS